VCGTAALRILSLLMRLVYRRLGPDGCAVAVSLCCAIPATLDEAMLADSLLKRPSEVLKLFAVSWALFAVQICFLGTRPGSGCVIFEQMRETQPRYGV
jgi:hypothetical protein